jgi:hypothetical protein
MRKTAFLAAAATVAGGLVAVLSPPTPAVALTETANVLVTNQYAGSTCGAYNHQIQIANAFTGALVQDLNSPSTAFQIPNDAKPFDLNRKIVALWGGDSTMTGSNGIGVYDRTTNAWTQSIATPSFERGANGAHAIAVLPDGYFAVALTGQLNAAGSGFVVVVSPTGSVVDSDALPSAHGVEYDGGRNAVFAVGLDDIRKYTYDTVTHQLVQLTVYDLPGTAPGGHDLRRRRTDSSYFVTTNSHAYTFNPDAGTFAEILKGGAAMSGVKSFDQRFDGITEYSYYQSNQFNFLDRAAVTSSVCLSGYKHGRFVYAPGDQVYPEDTASTTPPPATTGIGFGFPIDSVDEVQGAGADLTYGSYWEGQWVTTYGWGGLDTMLDQSIAQGVTPVIQWYYWGDAISDTCYRTGCGSKNKTEWDTLAGQLRDHVAAKMQGRTAIVVLETEWHKNGMEDETTFDGWLRNQMDVLRASNASGQAIKVALGWGHWASEPAYTTYTAAAQYADYNGTMILFSCLRDGFTNMNNSVSKVVTNATTLNTKYGKPVLVDDFALSTYSGASSGDPAYSTAPTPKDCDGTNYETLQETKYQEIFDRKAELKAAGVFGFVFRAYFDDWNRDPAGDYHLIAERWFGIVRDTASDPIRYKAAYDNVINGIKAEAGGAPPSSGGGGGTPPPTTGAEWAQEAESFATKPVGGQCTNSTASGGLCWNVWSNGTISTTLTAATAGVKHVAVRALGDPAAGVWPAMKVRVDGTQVMSVTVGTDQWTWYAAAVTLTAGSHTLDVEYTNDANVNGDDRNLLVDLAQVDPASRSWTQEAESFTTKTAGGNTPSTGASGGAYWNLWSNGYLETAMSVPYASQHEIEVVARGDVAGGVWPQMKVYVDGTLVSTQTVATTTWTTYPVRAVIGGGTHTLRIEFTNDAMVGTEDRNLKLDLASLYT